MVTLIMKIKSKIISEFNKFVDNISLYKIFDDMFNLMVKNSVLSIHIYDIVNGRKNKRKFILTKLNCFCLWFFSFAFIPFIASDKLINLIDNRWVTFDLLRQSLISMLFGLLLIASIRTDFLNEEKRNNLISLKFIYYLMMNDQFNHKLNNHNYKIYKIVANSIHVHLIKYAYPYIFIALLVIIVMSTTSQSFTLIILLPFNLFIYYIYLTSFFGILSLILSVLVYYILRFSQINTQLRLFRRLKKISHQTINRTINEHNQLSLAIHQFNSTMNKTVAWLFIITSIVLDMLLYMLIYSKSLYYKFIYIICCVVTLTFALIIDYVLIKISNSAHQSYNLMYSITQRQTLPYKTRIKVKLKYFK